MKRNRPSLHQQTLITLLTSAVIIFFCYLYIDKPTAIWTYSHHPAPRWLLNVFNHFPEVILILSLAYYPVYLLSNYFAFKQGDMRKLLVIANSVIITEIVKSIAKMFFGRYWPLDWLPEHNPALIPTNEYGFHFFHTAAAFHAFPSGHAAVTATAMTAISLLYQKLIPLCVTVTLLVCVSLVLLDYHFVGDVIGGATLGIIIARYAHGYQHL